MKKLPKTIFARLEKDGDDSYLVSDTVPDGCDGDQIGRYELVETGVVKVHPTTMEKRTSRR